MIAYVMLSRGGQKVFINTCTFMMYDMDGNQLPPPVGWDLTITADQYYKGNILPYTEWRRRFDTEEYKSIVGSAYVGNSRAFLVVDEEHAVSIGRGKIKKIDKKAPKFNPKFDFDFMSRHSIIDLLSFVNTVGAVLVDTRSPALDLEISSYAKNHMVQAICQGLNLDCKCRIYNDTAWLSNDGDTWFGICGLDIKMTRLYDNMGKERSLPPISEYDVLAVEALLDYVLPERTNCTTSHYYMLINAMRQRAAKP